MTVKRDIRGFTLIEIIVVIVIIAILVAVAVPAIMKYIDDARETRLITQASSAKTIVQTELIKYQAKSKDGIFDDDNSKTNLTQAINEAALENSDLITVDLCSDVEIGEDEIATCKPLTGKLHNRVENINSYIVNIYGYGKTVVVIENDGIAELAKGGWIKLESN